MISKELLKEMYDENELKSWFSETMFNYQNSFSQNDLIDIDINIFELAHKCKEWALNRNISVSSLATNSGGKCEIWSKMGANYLNKRFQADSEPEAIFKACEWILQNAK